MLGMQPLCRTLQGAMLSLPASTLCASNQTAGTDAAESAERNELRAYRSRDRSFAKASTRFFTSRRYCLRPYDELESYEIAASPVRE